MNADARRWGERGLAALLLALAAAVLIWGAAQLPLLDALVFGFDWHNYWMMFRGGWPDYGAADIFNPPWTLLLLWPLAALPYKTGWALVTLGTLIILTLSVPRRADGLPDGWGLLALFSSFWVLRQLAEGNIAGMMVLGCLLLLRGLQRQEPWSLAVGGLLITAKYQESWLLALGAAAVVLRTWPARRRALAAGLTLAVAGPSLALLGGPWLSRLLTPSGFSPAIARLSGNISLNALRALPGFPDWGAASAVALVLALTGWALWRSAAQGAPAITRASAGFLLAASMLCAPYTGGASLTTLLAVGLVPLWRWRFWPGLGLWVFANLPLWAAHLTPLWRWPDLPQCLLALCLWIALGAQTLAEARTPAAAAAVPA